jgi:hypothetical protein
MIPAECLRSRKQRYRCLLADESEVVAAAGGVRDRGAAAGGHADAGGVGDGATVNRNRAAPGVANADGVASVAALPPLLMLPRLTAPPLADEVATPPLPADAVSVNCMIHTLPKP